MHLNMFVCLLFVYCFVEVKCVIKNDNLITTGDHNKEEPRKKQQSQDLMSKILPMLASPFILQTTILPMVLMGMKFILLNSMFLGKLGIFFWIVNIIKNRSNYGGGLYSHNVNVHHNEHAGHLRDKELYKEHYGFISKEDNGKLNNRRRKRRV